MPFYPEDDDGIFDTDFVLCFDRKFFVISRKNET